jgi:hypothetical protein
LALKETDQFWKDMLNGKKHASEEITRAMANECILKKLVPTNEELNRLRQVNELNKIQNNMKAENIWVSDKMPDSVLVNGKPFKLIPDEKELTLEDCMNGSTMSDFGVNDKYRWYPTKAIAEKVLIYGLLQSVAHKLNNLPCSSHTHSLGLHPVVREWYIFLYRNKLDVTYRETYQNACQVIFDTKELAQWAISIFAKSKFDLKKLYQ